MDRNRPEWRISEGLVPYEEALATMEARVADIRAGRARELVWLLEHPPLYTAGTSSRAQDLLQPMRFPVHVAGRGGQYTYHGPGQRVVYVMLDLRARRQDVRRYVFDLEDWTIRTLARFNVTAERRAGRVGVWVTRPDKPKLQDGSPGGSPREDKIAAIGVRIRHWVAFHGISINVDPDLGHYAGIVPCGIADHGVTSLADLGLTTSLADLDMVLAETFDEVFGADPSAETAAGAARAESTRAVSSTP
jgi:lipoyl(octanoyl) transferase